jgi:hypothetical protein
MKIPASHASIPAPAAELDLAAVTGGGLGDIVDRVENRVEDVAHRVWYGPNYRSDPRYLEDPEHRGTRGAADRGEPTERSSSSHAQGA